MRSRFDSVVTLPTDDRVVGEPRCCCSATAGGRPSIVVDVGHAHLMEQPARVRRHRFEIAPLRLGVERAERERRLARAGDAGEHDERVARDVDVDVLEVVLARAAHADEAVHPEEGCTDCASYSDLNVIAGSIRAARHAGATPAAVATATSNVTTPP